jgi:hypothetical protein
MTEEYLRSLDSKSVSELLALNESDLVNLMDLVEHVTRDLHDLDSEDLVGKLGGITIALKSLTQRVTIQHAIIKRLTCVCFDPGCRKDGE